MTLLSTMCALSCYPLILHGIFPVGSRRPTVQSFVLPDVYNGGPDFFSVFFSLLFSDFSNSFFFLFFRILRVLPFTYTLKWTNSPRSFDVRNVHVESSDPVSSDGYRETLFVPLDFLSGRSGFLWG